MNNFQTLIPDAYNLIESQRSVGYIFETAVADIIDNSISAKAKKILLNANTESRNLTITDNGIGMNKKELLQAMRYGSKSSLDAREKDDLGRFGLGLKMASFSQCRKLTVISKQSNSLIGAVWDLDLVKEKNSWIIQVLSEDEISKNVNTDPLMDFSSGTMVQWEKFDKIEQHADFQNNFDETMERTEDHLSLVFHRFIQSGNLSIFLNDRKIDYVDPFFTSNKATQPKSPDVILEKNRNSRIEVQPFIVPYQNKLTQKERHVLKKFENNQLNPGLYVYRNKRLIAWGKWFKLVRPNELANLAKIQIDIPNTMDDLWEIDVKKSQLKIPSSIREQLRSIISKSIGESERVYKHRGTIRNKDNMHYIYNRVEKDESVAYQINRENPLIQQLQNNLSDIDNRLLSVLLNQLENFLPLESIQYDMASKREINKNNIDDDKIYEELMLIIGNQNSKASKLKLIEYLKTSENYSDKISIFKRIEDNLND
ncbi:ATP-binding protein [Streptococcus bovimastitidis]|uniref:ATP-binding protein n=1 Tax=Streptococcus bovimastitidis TaxID=1856638 RepID=A0A1L8MMP6_9STRE|nr:ATP-binding protein [Streptococcus bovimastitidis]OJF72009.1 ATP-binding protein [Streptococcus bovimastitidis]